MHGDTSRGQRTNSKNAFLAANASRTVFPAGFKSLKRVLDHQKFGIFGAARELAQFRAEYVFENKQELLGKK